MPFLKPSTRQRPGRYYPHVEKQHGTHAEERSTKTPQTGSHAHASASSPSSNSKLSSFAPPSSTSHSVLVLQTVDSSSAIATLSPPSGDIVRRRSFEVGLVQEDNDGFPFVPDDYVEGLEDYMPEETDGREHDFPLSQDIRKDGRFAGPEQNFSSGEHNPSSPFALSQLLGGRAVNDLLANNEPLEPVVRSRGSDSERDELDEDLSSTQNSNHMEIYRRGIVEGWVLMTHVFEGLWVMHNWDYRKGVVDVSNSMSEIQQIDPPLRVCCSKTITVISGIDTAHDLVTVKLERATLRSASMSLYSTITRSFSKGPPKHQPLHLHTFWPAILDRKRMFYFFFQFKPPARPLVQSMIPGAGSLSLSPKETVGSAQSGDAQKIAITQSTPSERPSVSIFLKRMGDQHLTISVKSLREHPLPIQLSPINLADADLTTRSSLVIPL